MGVDLTALILRGGIPRIEHRCWESTDKFPARGIVTKALTHHEDGGIIGTEMSRCTAT